MKFTKDDHGKVLKSLKTAYHEKDKIEVGGQWQQNVMRDIRQLAPQGSETNGYIFFSQFLWRAAPVVCMLILIVGAFIINLDFMTEYELANLLTSDPFESTTIESFFM